MIQRFSFFIFSVFLINIVAAQPANQAVNQKDTQGRKQGHWVKKAYDGQVLVDCYYRDGKRVGEYRTFYEKGGLQSLLIYGKTDTVKATLYHENGKIMAEGQYKDTLKFGAWKFYDDRQILSSIEEFEKGKLNGASIVFHLNSDTAAIKQYRDGLKNGLSIEYFEGHKLKSRINYVDDTPEGKVIFMYPNGKKSKEGAYANAVKEGVWFYYGTDGNLDAQELWKNGVLQKQVFYDKEVEQQVEDSKKGEN